MQIKEQHWNLLSDIFTAADIHSCEHQGKGVEAFKKMWEEKKSWMFPYFDNDGRIQVEVPSEIDPEDVDAAFAEGERIAHKLSANNKYAPVLLIDHGNSAFELLRWFLRNKVRQNEWIENKTEEKRPDPSRPEKSLPKGTKVSKYLNTYVQNDVLWQDTLKKGYGGDNLPLVIDFLNDVYSQMIAVIKRGKDWVVLSINPIDLVLAANHFSSISPKTGKNCVTCHRIIPEGHGEGPNKCGALSYALDNKTAVAFAYRAESRVRGMEFEWPHKIWRQYVHFDVANHSAFMGREYVHHNLAYTRTVRGLVAGILAKHAAIEEPKWWVKRLREDAPSVTTDDEEYKNVDPYRIISYLRSNPYHYSTSNDTDYPTAAIRLKDCDSKYSQIVVGAETVPCINCGSHRDDKKPERVVCWRCVPSEHCAHCGQHLMGSSQTVGKDYYCRTCYDEIFTTCPCCRERKRKDVCIEVNGSHVCKDCLERYFVVCDHCHKYYRKEDVINILGRKLCGSCKKDLVRKCDCCGEQFIRTETKHLFTSDGYILCEKCTGKMHECRGCHAKFLHTYSMIYGQCGECASNLVYIKDDGAEVHVV